MADDPQADPSATDELAEAEPDPTPAEPQQDEGEDKPLGEAGERALKREREARRKAEQQYKQLKSDTDSQIADMQRELLEELIDAKIEAAAGNRFAAPEDVRLYISPSDVTGKGGRVDPDKLAAALDALLEKKPHLAAVAKPLSNGFDNGAKPLTNGQSTDMNTIIRRAAGRN